MKTIRELLVPRRTHTLPATATALDAAVLMKAEHVGAVMIVDDDGKLAGCFSERDLTNRVIAVGLAAGAVTLGEVMTRDLFTASPDDRIHAIATEMQERHVRHLPVLEDGHLIAVLSLRDMLRELLLATRGQVQDLTRYIRGV